MGTFHNDKSDLHGITVVVDTKGPKVFVGRCDDEDEDKLILLDADDHEDGHNGRSKAEYVQRAAKFGVWKKHDHLVIPRADVASVKRLGDILDSAVGTLAAPAKPQAASGPQQVKSAGSDKTVVTLSTSAQAEVRRLVQAEGRQGVGLRLGVKGGGCSGFSYKLELDQEKEGDIVVGFDSFSVYLDRKSTIYLRGITLDHQQGLSGKGFVFHNPNATNSCGCGESFSV